MMINFEKVLIDDTEAVEELSTLATGIVKEHYDPIIGAEVNDYMINLFQSVSGIAEQLKNGYQYYVVRDKNGNKIGFFAYYPREKDVYLSKFYLIKEQRGKGIARDILQFVIGKTKEYGFSSIVLNVNKYNYGAIMAYEKMGFRRIRGEKKDIGNGYYMDDWIYEYVIEKGIC